MRHVIKKLFILVLTVLVTITITACSKKKARLGVPSINTNNNFDEIQKEMMDELKDQDLVKVDLPNPDALSNTFMDVEPNFTVLLKPKGAYLGLGEIEEGIKIYSSDEKEVNLIVDETITSSSDEKESVDTFACFSVSADGGYERGKAYTLSIENSPNLLFVDKDESVRKIVFSIKDSDREIITPKKDYKTYDINKLVYFDGYGEYNTYLIYAGSFDSKVGDIVIFKGLNDKGEDESIYIKVKKIDKNKNETRIYYECPNAGEIFSDLDIHVDNKKLDLENNITLRDKNQIIEDIKKTSFAEEAIAYAAYASNYDEEILKNAKDFWDHCFLDISFGYKDNVFSVGLTITFTFTTSNKWRVILLVKFTYSETYHVSADADIDTFLGIPYDISLNCSITSDVNLSVQFRICLSNPKFNSEFQNISPNEFNQTDAEKAVENLRKSWKEAKGADYTKNTVSGDTLMVHLGSVTLRFGVIALDFDLYFCVKNQLNISLGASYTYAYRKVVVNYCSSNDKADAGSSPQGVSLHCVSASLAGVYSGEAYLKLRISLYIVGFKWLASIYLDIDGGFYIEIKGLASVSYEFMTKKWSYTGGLMIEFGLFFRVTLNVNILGLVHPNFTLVNLKAPAMVLDLCNDLKDRSETGTIELNTYITPIEYTNMLTYNVFDYNSLGEILKNYKYDDEIVYFRSSFANKESYQLFSDFTCSDSRIHVINGMIIVDKDVAELNATISYKVNLGYTTRTDSVNVHYVSKEARYVTFDGQNKKAYLPGEKVDFYIDVDREGYIFKGYLYKGILYNSQSTFIMPDEDVNFELQYIEDKTFVVKFYDGMNNLIDTQEILNQEDAKELEEDYRDRFMDSEYTFVCWDRSIEFITDDCQIHGIYIKRSDII